ncbi:hypothetical protein QIH93_20980 [Bradyrhizobium ottawaense]|uniref:phage fiber-tail adaptor protein n=1 Tax=Bradyrhizobium ottawaense TaxID=931866 RepID=UPI0027154E7E|nr:hypothetical protein [Bradyrhizobium ottawaense]WLB43024.1 hypothetical protein QIH93_20980 [Bradyrhizobium ottawaense]
MSSRIVVLPHGLARVAWPSKSPAELLDYGVDWQLRFARGEAIAASSFELPAGVVATRSTFGGSLTQLLIAGGVNGELYRVLNRITTTGGRTLEQVIHLGVMSK